MTRTATNASAAYYQAADLAAGDVKRYEQFSRNEWAATPAVEGLSTLIVDADAWIADLKQAQGEDA